MKIELTQAQIATIYAALTYFLHAGTADECETVFGSPQSVRAAQNAADKIGEAIRWT